MSHLAASRSRNAMEGLSSQQRAKWTAMLLFLLPLAITIFLPTLSLAQSQPENSAYRGAPLPSDLASAPIERRVEALLKQMTLDEKIGQLVQYSVGTPTGPGTGRDNYEEMVAKGEVGSLFNVAGLQSANQFQHIAVEKSRLHIPLLYGLDMIHGYRTTFPVPLAMASTWDPGTGGKSGENGGQRSVCRRCALDVFAHGGHFARFALGPNYRKRGRRSVSR